MLSHGGGQGLLVVAAVQDLALLKARWKEDASAFLTLFGQTLVFPGIQDTETLEVISRSCGEWDRPEMSVATGKHPDGRPSITTTRQHRRHRVYEPTQIKVGIDPEDPLIVLCLDPTDHYPLEMSPYWKAAPWPQLLVACMERAVSGQQPWWIRQLRAAGYPVPPEDDVDPAWLRTLPVPDLEEWFCATRQNRYGWPWHLRAEFDSWPWHVTWADRYRAWQWAHNADVYARQYSRVPTSGLIGRAVPGRATSYTYGELRAAMPPELEAKWARGEFREEDIRAMFARAAAIRAAATADGPLST